VVFPKTENRKVKQVLSGRRKNMRKGYRRVTVVEILCTHV
jgi:hypothetical protein